MFFESADATGLSGQVKGHVGAGLKVDFNAKDTECTENGKADLCGGTATTIINGSRSSNRLSIVFWITELAFERGWRKLKDFKELG